MTSLNANNEVPCGYTECMRVVTRNCYSTLHGLKCFQEQEKYLIVGLSLQIHNYFTVAVLTLPLALRAER